MINDSEGITEKLGHRIKNPSPEIHILVGIFKDIFISAVN